MTRAINDALISAKTFSSGEAGHLFDASDARGALLYNLNQVAVPLTPDVVMPRSLFQGCPTGEPVEDRDSQLQLGDLSLEVPGNHSFTQSFEAAHWVSPIAWTLWLAL